MPSSKSSLITLKHFDNKHADILFSEALKLKKNFDSRSHLTRLTNYEFKGTAALLFFEPSTRTRFSFEAACSRAGFHPMILDGGIGTSLEKGETIEDTIFNIQALKPTFFVIRCHDLVNLPEIESQLDVPLINAGWGKQGHPTQALLDALTIYEKFGSLDKKNVLFIGDVKHSRVVSSHLELAQKLNYNMAFCGPSHFFPDNTPANIKKFNKISEALEWADVAIALRVQKERHDNENIFLLEDYRENFALNNNSIKHLKVGALIMHPGPVNYGVEIESEILRDPRCVILKQVENGVFLREAIVRGIVARA